MLHQAAYIESSLNLDLDFRLGGARYERSDGRMGYRNGGYTRDLLTSYGWIEGLEVPRASESAYQPRLLERARNTPPLAYDLNHDYIDQEYFSAVSRTRLEVRA